MKGLELDWLERDPLVPDLIARPGVLSRSRSERVIKFIFVTILLLTSCFDE